MPEEFDSSQEPKDAYQELLENSLAKARLNQNASEEAKILLDLGYWHEEACDYDQAIECFEAGLMHLKKTSQYAISLPALFHLAQIYRSKKKGERAFTLYNDIVEFAEKIWDHRSKGLGLALKGEILLEQGAHENGFEWMFKAFQTLEEAKLVERFDVAKQIQLRRRQIPGPVFDLALSRSKIPQKTKDLLKSQT